MSMDTDLGTVAIPESNVLTKFTDYNVNMPDWLIEFITNEAVKRDIKGLTNNVIQKLQISGEHPLVQMTAAVFDPKGGSFDVSGFLPAISVVEGDEDEEPTLLGNGYRKVFNIDQTWIDTYRTNFPEQSTAIQDGLLSEEQLKTIESYLLTLESGKQVVGAVLEGFFLRTNMMVGVWVQSIQERSIIGNLIRSVLFDARKYLSAERHVRDTHIRTAKGLVNTNFGMILFGQESTLDFINIFHNITVTKEIPLDVLLDLANTDDVIDTAPGYYPAHSFDDNLVQYPPGAEVPETGRS